RYPAMAGAGITSLVTGFVGGAAELVGGVGKIVGNPLGAIEGIGALLTINKNTGEIGDTGMAGQAWKGLGKALISYEEFEEGHVGTGLGKVGANILSLFIGGGSGSAGEAAAAASRLARAEKVLAAGEKAGMLTGRVAEATTFMKVFGTEVGKKLTFRGSGDAVRAADLAKAAEGSLKALKAVEGAGNTAGMVDRGATALKNAERVEGAAGVANKFKAAEAENLAKLAKQYADKLKNKYGDNIPNSASERLAAMESKASAAKIAAENASQAANFAREAASQMRDAQRVIKEAAAAEKALGAAEGATKGALKAKATAKAEAAAAAVDDAITAAEWAEQAALKVGKTSPALNLAKSLFYKFPGGKQAASRVAMVEGVGGKTLSVLRGVVSVPARTALEAARFTLRAGKAVLYEVPVGLLKGTGRLLKALPELTRLTWGKAWGKGGAALALRMQKVGRALKIMETDGGKIAELTDVMAGKVLGRTAEVDKILAGIRGDASLSSRFKNVEWDKVAKLIKEDPSLTDLWHAYPEVQAVVQNRALLRLMEVDKEAAIALSRIMESSKTLMEWSAYDERVAVVIDRIFKKGMYPVVAAKPGFLKRIFGRKEKVTEAAAAGAAEGAAKVTYLRKAGEGENLAHLYEYRNTKIVLSEKDIAAKADEIAAELRNKDGFKAPEGAAAEKAWAEANWNSAIKSLSEERFAAAKMEVQFLETVGKEHHYIYRDQEIVLTEEAIAKKAEEIAPEAPGAVPESNWDNAIKMLLDEKFAVAEGIVKMGVAAKEFSEATARAEAAAAAAKEAVAVGKSKGYMVGRYMRNRMSQAKNWYAEWKARPSNSLKQRYEKILTEQSALLVAMTRGYEGIRGGSIEDRINDIDARIVAIEGMATLPPDVKLPADVEEILSNAKEKAEAKAKPAGGRAVLPDIPVTGGGGEVVPVPVPVPVPGPTPEPAPKPTPEPVPGGGGEVVPGPAPRPAPSTVPGTEIEIEAADNISEDIKKAVKSGIKKALGKKYKNNRPVRADDIREQIQRRFSYKRTDDKYAQAIADVPEGKILLKSMGYEISLEKNPEGVVDVWVTKKKT
ncbi:hypothetical protein KKH03_00195, partial [Patescibacteria group bacterium]|nr:hypothetical protein [Patescibacteria group bacterium]